MDAMLRVLVDLQVEAQAAQAQDVNKLYSIAILLRNVRFIEIVLEIYLYANYA